MSLTQMTGFFIKQRKNNKSYKICYFYLDSYGILYYLNNLAQLNYYIKTSTNEIELINKLENSSIVSKISISNCRISAIKQFQYIENIPFYHRNYFDLQVQKKSVIRTLQVFAIIEDDIERLQDRIKQGQSKQKPSFSQQNYDETEQKAQFINKIQELLHKYIDEPIVFDQQQQQETIEQSNQSNQQERSNQNQKLTYIGEVKDGKAHGSGTLIYNEEGIQYKGQFKDGKKHGLGYFADSNLYLLECEFINDILAEI